MPSLYIISGPNGAGKTTASFTMLPELLLVAEFINADEIARGLSPFNPEGAAFEAGRIMLHRMEDLLNQQQDFAFETTLASLMFSGFIKRAKAAGYSVHLFHYWLNSPALAVQRVARRVSQGGHNIPLEVIHRRYIRGIRNFLTLYSPLADFWMLMDNSENAAELIAEGTTTESIQIHRNDLWALILKLANDHE